MFLKAKKEQIFEIFFFKQKIMEHIFAERLDYPQSTHLEFDLKQIAPLQESF